MFEYSIRRKVQVEAHSQFMMRNTHTSIAEPVEARDVEESSRKSTPNTLESMFLSSSARLSTALDGFQMGDAVIPNIFGAPNRGFEAGKRW